MPRASRIVALAILLLLALPLSNFAIAEWQHAANPVPGAFFSVEGRRMHLYCSGAGSPTILIEAGASADWLGWQAVQSTLSSSTRICTYDRAGHGWSQPRSGPRDAETIVRELHSLLDQAAIPRPLVLAGHSAGGLYVREYAREFPAEIAGVILIDSSSPQQIDELPGWRQSYEADKRDRPARILLQRLRVWSGWDRLTGNCHNEPSPELRNLAAQYDAEMCRPKYVGGEDSELPYFETSCRQAARLTTFGDIPLLVLSRDPSAEHSAGNRVWEQEQESLKQLSPISWRIIARTAGHAVHHDRLDVIVAETTRLLSYVRRGPAPPWGTTSTE
ncbi:MAG TPA: alpha/beta hydrolase [Bryobacteraceae bacterium]